MKNFDEVLKRVRGMQPFRVAVAAAEDSEVLRAVKAAVDMGFVAPVLVGDTGRIAEIAAEIGLAGYEVVDAKTPEEAAALAVAEVRAGRAQLLMKGLVNTSVYMRAILHREEGLRTGRLLSLLAVYELPAYHKLLFATDSGINPAPDLEKKKQILENALQAMHAMGVEEPKTAALTANEAVDPKIPSTTDAAALVELAAQGGLPRCILEGPIAFDVAFDEKAAAHKGIESRIAGDVDLLLFPNIEAGNMLGKSWLRFNNARWAGLVLGASKPVILGSRADTPETKLYSLALGCLASTL